MPDKNITADKKSQSFATPIKHNQLATSPSIQILLGYDILKFQHNTKTCMTRQKLTPNGNEYLCFQNGGENSWAEQCAKSRALNKAVDSIIDIGSFQQQCVIININN